MYRALSIVLMLAMLAAHRATPQILSHATQTRIVSEVKNVPAHVVDAQLPYTSLAAWMATALGANSGMQWAVSDCDLKPDFSQSPETYPLCVALRANTPQHISMKLHFLIGTRGSQRPERPTLEKQSFLVRGNILLGCVASLDRLSELPFQLRRLAAMQKCE